MSEIIWKTKEEIEQEKNKPKPPTEIEVLQRENQLLKAKNQALVERTDFHEELIAEMAMLIYP